MITPRPRPKYVSEQIKINLVLDRSDIKTLAKHKYAELSYCTDAMLDLWNEIVDQILEP